jgi:hypothetical protein
MNRKKRVIPIHHKPRSYSHNNDHHCIPITSCVARALLVCTSTAAMSTLLQ